MNSLFIDITKLFLICNEHSFKRLYWFFVLCLVIGISDVTVLAVVFFSYQVIFRKEDFGADILANLVPQDLLVGAIIFVIFLSSLRILFFKNLISWCHHQRHSVALMMFENYQNKSLNELEILGSDTVAKNTLSETEQLLLNVIFPLMNIATSFSIIILYVGVCLFADFLITIFLFGLVGIVYLSFSSFAKNFLIKLSEERLELNKKMFAAVRNFIGGFALQTIRAFSRKIKSDFEVASERIGEIQTTFRVFSFTPKYLLEMTGYTVFLAILLFFFDGFF